MTDNKEKDTKNIENNKEKQEEEEKAPQKITVLTGNNHT